jgi:ribonuclease HI
VLCGGARGTTNNRAELTAAIVGLTVLPPGCRVTVVSDSRYVVGGAGFGARKRRARHGQGRKLVPNTDLWHRIDAEQACRVVTWQWLRGHAGNADNVLADRLAARGMTEGPADRHRPIVESKPARLGAT